jgi:arylamine N-acetyltransferase
MKVISDYWDNAESLEPNYENLAAIHRLFVHEPTFSSLKIMCGIKPEFDTAFAYNEVVITRRSDTCRMINLAAKHLLLKIGYKSVDCISTEIVNIHDIEVKKGTSVHMTMVVTLVGADGEASQFVFDPGFGNAHRSLLPLRGDVVHDVMSDFRVIHDRLENKYSVQERFGVWKTQFIFKLTDIMNRETFDSYVSFVYQDDHFFRNNIYIIKCSEEGCIEILNGKFRVRKPASAVVEKSVLSEGGMRKLLITKFGIPVDYVDSIDINSDGIKPPLRELLSIVWQPSELAASRERLRSSTEHDSHVPAPNSNSPKF